MNPIFDPGTSGAPQFVPGNNPGLYTGLASTGGDPGTVGGGPGQLAQTPGTPAGGSGVPEADQQHLASPGGPSTRPAPTGGQQQLGAPSWYTPPPMVARPGNPARAAYIANWDPNAPQNTGRRRPAPDRARGPIQSPYDWSRYTNFGGIGNSNPALAQFSDPAWHPAAQPGANAAQGQTYDQWRQEMAATHPWMNDTSVMWGGGSQGYLPINYQPHDIRYYMNTPNLAPWEGAYFGDTWTQNIQPDKPGYWDPQRVQNDPSYNPVG